MAGEEYPYVDQTVDAPPVLAHGISEASSAELNPAFYPQHAKPEAMHTEAEKAGLGYAGPVDEDAEEDEDAAPKLGPVVYNEDGSATQENGPDLPAPKAQPDLGVAPQQALPVTPETAPADDADDDKDSDDADGQPAGNASTEEWVTYAESQGMAREDAEALGRDGLRDHYTS